MNFLLDHDVPADIGRVLTQAEHDVDCVKDVLSPTASDQEVLKHAIAHNLVLITCNRDDFLTLAAEQDHYGIVILVRRRTRIAECAAVIRLLERAGHAGIEGNINFA